MRFRWTIPAGMALALMACGETREEDVAGDPRADETEQRAFPLDSDPASSASEPDVAAPAESPPPAEIDTDLEIARKVREKLVAEDEPLSDPAQNVSVVAADGVVTVSGRVQTEQEKDRVLEIVRSTEGVSDVEDKLEVAAE